MGRGRCLGSCVFRGSFLPNLLRYVLRSSDLKSKSHLTGSRVIVCVSLLLLLKPLLLHHSVSFKYEFKIKGYVFYRRFTSCTLFKRVDISSFYFGDPLCHVKQGKTLGL